MAEAETSSARLAYVKESSYGVNPGTGAKFLRITSESLKQDQQRTTSEEVTGSRLPRESIRTGVSASGDVNFEVSAGTIDDLFEGAMMASLPAAPSVITASIAAVASTQKFTAASGLGGLVKGQMVRTAGFTAPANNGIFRLAANSTATEITVETGSGIVDEASASRSIQPSQMLRPGSTLKSFTLERQWTDATIFEEFNGMVIESLSLSAAVDQVMTGSVTFMGKDAGTVGTSSVMGTVAAVNTEQIASAVEALRNIREGGYVADAAYHTTELSLQFNNATRIKKDAASLSAFGVGLGIIECTATWKIFLSSKALIDKFRANTTTSLQWRIIGLGASSPTYVITMTKARITDLDDPITGNSEDGFLNLTLMAETDADGVAFQIDKIPTIP